jgi:hypothetical protein
VLSPLSPPRAAAAGLSTDARGARVVALTRPELMSQLLLVSWSDPAAFVKMLIKRKSALYTMQRALF